MAKLMTYVITTVGIVILMNIFGLQTTSGYILGQLGININNVENISLTSLYIAIFVAIGLLAAASAIRIGTLGVIDVSSTGITALVFGTPLAVLIGDLTNIVIQAKSSGNVWAGYITFAILVPFIFGYLISMYDWIRGVDP